MRTQRHRQADTRLQQNIDPYYQWAQTHNSLLIVTWDESGVIPTIFAGAHIKPGDYDEGKGINHVSILRTLEAMYSLPRAGAQQVLAARAGISDSYIITDVFGAK